MQIDVKVIPGAKQNSLKEENGLFKVHLTASAVDGKANRALIEFLSRHFAVKKREIEIIKGLKSRRKTINIQ